MQVSNILHISGLFQHKILTHRPKARNPMTNFIPTLGLPPPFCSIPNPSEKFTEFSHQSLHQSSPMSHSEWHIMPPTLAINSLTLSPLGKSLSGKSLHHLKVHWNPCLATPNPNRAMYHLMIRLALSLFDGMTVVASVDSMTWHISHHPLSLTHSITFFNPQKHHPS